MNIRPPKPFVARKCGIKRRYDSYSEAFRVARLHWSRYRENMVPYRCPLCGKFHIGHQKTEEDLSTAFVPLVSPKPKQEPKPKNVKQPPPVKKQKEVLAYYPPEDPFKKMEIRASNRAMNEDQRVQAIERKKARQEAHAKLLQEQHDNRVRKGLNWQNGYMWQMACDDGWNQRV